MEQLLGSRVSSTNDTISILWVQITLNKAMGTKIPEDDLWGPRTKFMIERFQFSRKLEITGKLTPQTIDALNQVSSMDQMKPIIKETHLLGDKILIKINEVLDYINEEFMKTDVMDMMGLLAYDVDDIRGFSLKSLYDKVLKDRDYLKRAIRKMPKNYDELNRVVSNNRLANHRNITNKIITQRQMKVIRTEYLVETGRKLKIAETFESIIDGTNKVISFLKPIEKVFKVLSWTEIAYHIKKSCTSFQEGKWKDMCRSLCDLFTKIIDIAFSSYLSNALVAGAVTITSALSLGPVSAAIAALIAVIVAGIIIQFGSEFIKKTIDICL